MSEPAEGAQCICTWFLGDNPGCIKCQVAGVPSEAATEETGPANPYAVDPDADHLPAIMAEMYRRPPMGVRPRLAPRPRNAEE